MQQANTILGLLAQTSIHAGTGSNTGVIDLPIQREGHNGWPCVFGSAMKGALRTRAETHYPRGPDGKLNPSVKFVFGPESNGEIDHAGALMVSDARLLLLPIRSLTSQFKWVTCPDALKRFKRDAERFGMKALQETIPAVTGDNAVVPQQTKDGALFLEEYRFDAKMQNLDGLIKSLANLMQRDDAETALQQQLVIVSNDMFAHLCQHATPVNAHIAIDSDTKTVRNGALWYEETLPPETLLYVGLSATKARAQNAEMPAESILGAVTGLFAQQPWLQVGGNETVGMGWCAIKALGGK
ncbi:type III-B CRISPR module RAMP protein Cmr4 [Thiothrix lacustris]|uniref:Type III-B CRISPR module RAMP protein Cmr4 n=1 Tax=Thiothrix lacustris TaxID=525917 RepID=A0ABY9MV23_9GAMM|nr:type III-B CRISPR module RAMP protein Cmr4 [Thiothrix lacustris]WML91636.1 type III-B CRISPR module RAMP protein Cmr4 [Thiothrix lacustris]